MMLHRRQTQGTADANESMAGSPRTRGEYCKDNVSEMYGSLSTILGSLSSESEILAKSESLAMDEYFASMPFDEAQILAARTRQTCLPSRTRGYLWSTSNRCSSTCLTRCLWTAFFSSSTCVSKATKSSTTRQSTRPTAVAATRCANFPL